MTVDVMIDLETLGTRPGCKVLSIGAAAFSSSYTGRTYGATLLPGEFYYEIHPEDQGDLVAEADTIEWWKRQAPEVRDRLFNDTKKVKSSLQQVLIAFNGWLHHLTPALPDGHADVRVWGNGADFDNAILAVAYAAACPEPPAWPFWNNRCYRTLKNLVPSVRLERVGQHHNALDDARSQAEHAIRLLGALGPAGR